MQQLLRDLLDVRLFVVCWCTSESDTSNPYFSHSRLAHVDVGFLLNPRSTGLPTDLQLYWNSATIACPCRGQD